MKIDRSLRRIFYSGFCILYFTGAAYWSVGFSKSAQLGPPPGQALALHAHGIMGLGFLLVFGMVFRAHVIPSLKGIRHLPSGWTLLVTIGVLCGSVPLLYYLGDEKWRTVTAAMHTYLGLFAAVPVLFHIAYKLRS